MQYLTRSLFIILAIFLCNAVNAQVKFIIESLPKSTPPEDTIFVGGSFNNWHAHDMRYMLEKQLDGKYVVVLPADTGKIEFKFSRGSWNKVESDIKNSYLENRVFEYGNGEVVSIKIENWSDLGIGQKLDYSVLLIFAFAIYGIILIVLVLRIKKRDRLKSKVFVISNLVLILTLLGGVVYNLTNLIWKANVAHIANVLFAFWWPLLYIFLYMIKNNSLPRRMLVHFWPAMLAFLYSVSRISNIGFLSFLVNPVNNNLSLGSLIAFSFATMVSVFYLIKVARFLPKKMTGDTGKKPLGQFVSLLFAVNALAFVAFIFNIVFISRGSTSPAVINFDLFLLAISLNTIAEFYFIWRSPELLKEKSSSQLFIHNPENLKKKLVELMNEEKPYTNPELNIAELSEMLGSKPHIVSKLLNEVFRKSFRDFINEYRIEEFISLIKTSEYRNYTFLALAHEVGFNSKSTFNLAFKKHTKLSPREYFKKHKMIDGPE